MNINDLFNEEKVRLDPKCWTGKKIGNPKTKMKGGVRVNNCVPAESIAEGTGNIGNAIKSLYQKIYNAGDDEIEYFYHDSPVFAQYWDEYEGDLDSIIAEVDPAELQIIHDELESYLQQAGLAEGSEQKKPLRTHKSGCGYNYGHDCDCGGTLTHASNCNYNYGHDCDCGLDKQQGVAEGSTTRGGFGGSAGQAQHEIEWLKKKISSLPPTKEKQIRDLQRQIRERELAIAFQKQGVSEGSYDNDPGIKHTRGSLLVKLEALPRGSDDFEWNRQRAIQHLKQGNMIRAKYYMMLMKRGEPGVAEGQISTVAIEYKIKIDDGKYHQRHVICDKRDLEAKLNQLRNKSNIKDIKIVKQGVAEGMWDRHQSIPELEKAIENLIMGYKGGINLTDKGRAQLLLSINKGKRILAKKKQQQGMAEGEQKPGADYIDPKEVDYDDEYDAMVARVKKLAGLGPMKTVYDPAKRQYRNMPTAVQPKK